ncbi:MAG: hypothetical protein HY288_17185 [Planctomycetia bacterium]|nr:hypothetical protein [Planctomycetia bacterium]
MTAMWQNRFRPLLLCLVALAGPLMVFERVQACPFCAAVSLTFSEEINNSQVAVIAKLVQLPPRPQGAAAQNSSLDVAKAKFEVITILKGEDVLGKNRNLETVYFGDSPVGATFLIMGIDPPTINWGTPIAISHRGQAYVTKAMALPKEGPDRMAFFQDYFEDTDDMLARDAYDEFAKIPYSGVRELKDRMKHDKLIEWITSAQVPVSRRRLYLTMLGACGTEKDLPLLEEMIRSKDRQTKGALDALVAAYLTMKGPEGMPLVEDLFLKNKDAEYTDTYATIMALRFHGTEEKIIPRERLLVGIRAMLDRPQLADLVIPDLARWEDWSVMDRLVDLFKNADDESSWVRVPVINYLRACPLPQAKEQIDELAKLDPDTVKRANTFFPLAGAVPAAAAAKTVDTAVKKDAAPAAEPTASGKSQPASQSSAPPAAAAPQNANYEKGSGEATSKSALPPGASSTESADQTTAGLAQPLSKNAAATPTTPATNFPVFGGLAAAAVLLGCAFWAILKGGQHAAG